MAVSWKREHPPLIRIWSANASNEGMAKAPSLTTISLLALMKLRRVGRVTALKIVERALDETGVESCREALLSRVASELPHVRAGELSDVWMKSVEQLERGREAGVQAIAFHEAGFPARLRGIPDPPAILFVKGSPDGLHVARSLAVVGTRKPTSFGRKVAERSGRTAAQAGYVVVSGLAHGCDTHAHEGCLDAGGIGVMVMAHGLDRVYPAANRGLAERLLDGGGCMTSEYPVGTSPVRSAFAERDRIQSGLSDGVLVIETDVKGGTMHTVRFARAQRRALACIDHPAQVRSEEKARGNRILLEEGDATPIADADALSVFLHGLKPMTTAEPPVDQGDDIDQPQTSFAF